MDNQFNGYSSAPVPSQITTSQLRELRIKSAKRGISRLFVALSFFFIIAYAALYGTVFALAFFAPDFYREYIDNEAFNMILSSTSMYLVAFPAFYLIVRKMPKRQTEKGNLSIGNFFIALFISEAMMLIGNVIATLLMNVMESVIGGPIQNSTSDLVSALPDWLLLSVVVVIGPIVEELMFRRLFIDRLSVHGDMFAIIVSAVAFGIFHQNIYQLFYATLLGAVLGYIYTRTRRIIYPIIFHMIINFLGSFVALNVQDSLNKLIAFTENAEFLEDLSFLKEISPDMLLELIPALLIVIAYSTLVYGMSIAGAILLIVKLKTRSLVISRECPRRLDKDGLVQATLSSGGVIFFLVISTILTFMNIILPMINQ